MYTDNDLTPYELKLLKKRYNDWINSNNYCMCNTHKQMDLYRNNNEYKYIYDKKINPRGHLYNYQEYNFNHKCNHNH